MSISIQSKNIRKAHTYCHVKINRAISKIVRSSNEEVNELINASKTKKNKCCSMQAAVPPKVNVLNRKDDLRMWVLGHNITRRAVNDLLKVLRSFGLNWLSMDSRTLCKTPRSTNVIALAGGQYWYNGIGTNIKLLFADMNSNLTLELNINVDGIPLMKSSSAQFWPIMGNFHSEWKINRIVIMCINK